MQRVDRQGSFDTEKTYSLSMMQELKIGNQIKESTSCPITAPPKTIGRKFCMDQQKQNNQPLKIIPKQSQRYLL